MRPVGGCLAGAQSNSSGSHSSSQLRLVHQYSPPTMAVGPSAQTTPAVVHMFQQPATAVQSNFDLQHQQLRPGPFEDQQSSVDMADNMTYSEVESTDGDRDRELDESDFDKACSSSAYGENPLEIDFAQPAAFSIPFSSF